MKSLKLFAAAAVFAMFAFGCQLALADQPPPIPLTSDTPLPASVMGRALPPLASFGVMQCGEVVAIWVVLQDKSVVRTDAAHHPDSVEEFNAFLQWIATAQSDIYTMPCLDNDKRAKKP